MESLSDKTGELTDLLEYRCDRLGLVASIFAHETPEETVRDLLGQATDFDQELGESIESDLKRGLRSLSYDDISSFATKTRTEYARLFLGPREVVAPLHESAYLSGTSRTFTSETLAVRRFYEQYGYMMKEKNSEPDDSIGAELEFLRNLCNRCIALLENGIDNKTIEGLERLLSAQQTFKEQHLHRWVQSFVERVVENDKSGYYKVWASYLSGVINEDKRLVDDCCRLLVEIERTF